MYRQIDTLYSSFVVGIPQNTQRLDFKTFRLLQPHQERMREGEGQMTAPDSPGVLSFSELALGL